jgi:hypothetical protein
MTDHLFAIFFIGIAEARRVNAQVMHVDSERAFHHHSARVRLGSAWKIRRQIAEIHRRQSYRIYSNRAPLPIAVL